MARSSTDVPVGGRGVPELASHRRARLVALSAATGIVLATVACSPGRVELDVPDPIAGGVTGVLFVDSDHDGQHGDREPVLADWTIGVYGTGPLALQETVTDSAGRFEFADVQGLAGDDAVLKFAPHVDAPGAFDASTSQLHQRLDVRLGESVEVAVRDFEVCEQLEGCDVDLPDLMPVLDLGGAADSSYPGTQEWYLDTTEQPGHVLLRFASMTSNVGDGLLHFTAIEPPSGAQTQPIQQRIYGERQVFVQTAGEFVYHPTHDHIHVDNFETYQLQLRPAGSTEAVASSSKVSFCLTDVAAIPDYPSAAAASGLTLDLPPMSCGSKEQGISPGFTDYYGPQLADQWIDVTDVPTGDYDLVLIADPDNFIVESDETNNVVSFSLHYVDPLR